MKNLSIQCCILIWLLYTGASGTAFAQSSGAVNRKFTKTYTDLKNEKLLISNQYGNVNIIPWLKKKIQVDITIVAVAKTNAGAELLANRISIEAGRTAEEITCKTNIAEADTLAKERLPAGKCTITYTVHLPAEIALKISNQFGDIIMGRHTGALNINEEFGSFKASNISNLDSLFVVQSNLNIGNIGGGVLVAKGFGSIKIDTIAGNTRCFFALGNTLDIGLVKGHYNFTMKAASIKAINFRCAKNLAADITVSTVVSKIINQSSLVLAQLRDSSAATGRARKQDTVTRKPAKDSAGVLYKKIDALKMLDKNPVRYHSVSGDGSAVIVINAAFSGVTFKQEP